MAVSETTEYPMGINFDDIKEMFKETDRKFQETDRRFQETDRQFKETAREMAELNRETREQMKETAQETERMMLESKKAVDKQIGSLTNLFGDFTLGMVIPKLREKFYELGLVFLKSSPNPNIEDRINGISFEIDILLENGDTAMLVEVKTKLTKERIYSHIERMEKMRRYADLHGDKRTFLGAVAGFAISDEVRSLAFEEGFYVIEPDGENFVITPPQGKAKEW